MLRISETVVIHDWEITETFHRASGPGGQNVNKVSSAVALRFEAERSPQLSPGAKARLRRLAGRRWTADGALIVTSERFRAQSLNREEARAKLAELIRAALKPPKRRIPTRPGRGAIERRLRAKADRSAKKAGRGPVTREE